MCSMPMHRRIMSGVTPADSSSSSVSCRCVVDAGWAAENLQTRTCVQGNLDQTLLVTGGDKLISETKRIVETFSQGPHIFNLGHGITPDADPKNVEVMVKAVSG